ncbi:transposable element Tcb2 transposase [Trichonephila clavipes]|nr:transposable element Tcb2 transposase [Trichonephila clavipes]
MDESRFSGQAILNARGWREVGTRFLPSNLTERDCNSGPGRLGKHYTERETEPIFDSDSVTGDRYCAEVVFPNVRMFRGAIGPDFVFMDDNPRPYQNADVKQLLKVKISLD